MVANVREKDPSTRPVNFLSESDHRFADLRSTRDRIAHETLTNWDWSRSSVSRGNHWRRGGSHVEKRYPGTSSPSSLMNTVFLRQWKNLMSLRWQRTLESKLIAVSIWQEWR